MANLYQNALMGQMQGEDDPLALPKPKNGNTGVTGLAGAPLPNPQSDYGGGTGLVGGTAGPAPAPIGGAPQQSWQDYLMGKTREFQPTLHTFQGEDARKSETEKFLNSLLPELNQRGAGAHTVKGENFTANGRIYDIFRDIEGAGEAQLLDKTDEINADKMRGQMGGWVMGGGVPLNSLLQGDPLSAINNAIGGYGEQSEMLKALLAQLGGGQ